MIAFCLPRRITSWFIALALLVPGGYTAKVSGRAGAAEAHEKATPVELEISTASENGIFPTGKPIRITVSLTNSTPSPRQGSFEWRLETATRELLRKDSAALSLAPREERRKYREFVAPGPGFYFVVSTYTEEAPSISVSRSMRVGYAPESLDVPLTAEPDFGSFWDETRTELEKVAPDFKVIAQPELSDAARTTFLVEMRSLENVLVRGWLETPTAPGRHPAVLRLPGYGSNMQPVRRFDDLIIFSFNPRGHGNSQDDVSGRPENYWIRGLDDKRDYFYRGAYMDCLRAFRFLASRKDVDPARIAVWGTSQGGGLSFATAALDERVRLCVSDIPFLVDFVNYFKLTRWPEMDEWIAARAERTWETTLRTLSYFDTLNMTARIRCRVLMGVGLQDKVCPPTTNFAAFNRITAPAEYRVYPQAGHGLPSAHREHTWRSIRGHLGLGRKQRASRHPRPGPRAPYRNRLLTARLRPVIPPP